MNKKIITNKQLFSLAAEVQLAVRYWSCTINGIAKQDAWIGALIALIYGACYIFMLTSLAASFQHELR